MAIWRVRRTKLRDARTYVMGGAGLVLGLALTTMPGFTTLSYGTDDAQRVYDTTTAMSREPGFYRRQFRA